MRHFLIALMLALLLTGCGSGSGSGGTNTEPSQQEPDQRVNIFFCEFFSLFTSSQEECNGIEIPTQVRIENDTPTISPISTFGCAMRVSWVPSDFVAWVTDYKILWLQASLTSWNAWDDAGLVEIPASLGVLNWEITFPASGRWAFTMQEKIDGTWRERGRISVLTVNCDGE